MSTFLAADLTPAGTFGDMKVGHTIAVCRVSKAGERPAFCAAFLTRDGRHVMNAPGPLRFGIPRITANLSPRGIQYVRPKRYSLKAVQSLINAIEGEVRS